MSESELKFVAGEEVDEDALKNGHEEPTETIEPPEISGARFGALGMLWRMYRQRRKERKYADEGYVQWYLVGAGWPEPKYVKPEGEGGGIPEYEHNDETYLFPTRGRMASRDSGMWTVIHKEGESEPINLRDPTENAIKADELKEYLTKRVTSSPPSFFDNFDLSADNLIKYSIAAIILFALLSSVLGGGL